MSNQNVSRPIDNVGAVHGAPAEAGVSNPSIQKAATGVQLRAQRRRTNPLLGQQIVSQEELFHEVRSRYGMTSAGEVIVKGSLLSKAVQNARTSMKSFEDAAAPKGFLAQLIAKITSAFDRSAAAMRERLDGEVSERVRELKQFSDAKIAPVVREIQRAYGGETFVRTKETPKALLLAAVPTEKVGKVVSFNQLVAHVSAISQPNLAVREISEGRLQMIRLNSAGKQERLEFSFRREGKVDIILNGQVLGPAWTDAAMKMAKRFAVGGEMKTKAVKYSSYTVEHPKPSARDAAAA
jgi:hypothetical protein